MRIMRVQITIEKTSDCQFASVGKNIEAMNPKELLLYAAAKCAALTLKSILDKEHICPEKVEITISGELDTEYVMAQSVYRNFNILYRVECSTLSEHNKISRALKLTTERYCGMLQMLKRIAPLSHEISVVSIESVEA